MMAASLPQLLHGSPGPRAASGDGAMTDSKEPSTDWQAARTCVALACYNDAATPSERCTLPSTSLQGANWMCERAGRSQRGLAGGFAATAHQHTPEARPHARSARPGPSHKQAVNALRRTYPRGVVVCW